MAALLMDLVIVAVTAAIFSDNALRMVTLGHVDFGTRRRDADGGEA